MFFNQKQKNKSEFVIPMTMDMPNGDLFLRMLNSNITIDLNESNYYLNKRFEEIGKIIQRIKNIENSLQF